MRGHSAVAVEASDLLFGGNQLHTVEIPAHVLSPGGGGAPAAVVVRPLRLMELQRIQKAAQESQALTSVLMVQQALVEPKVTVEEVNRMHAGLVEFVLREVNRVSGLSLDSNELQAAVQAPLARACLVLAREFGWTPDECAGLTLGQILLYVEMIGRGERPSPAHGPAPA
jgi:hypothetical protein